MPLIELRHGEYRAGIDPGVGGGLAYWRQSDAGHDLVRPAQPGEDDPLQFGCFPLVPYSNRIRDGRFSFAGQSIQLPLNFGDHPHSIHGHGWQHAWEVVNHDAAALRLQYRHDAGAWPFPYLAEQVFRLDDGGLSIELRLVNQGTGPMPCGLGLHPYFPATPETRIEARVDGVWLTDDEVMPTTWCSPPENWRLSQGRAVSQMACDNLFTGWDGTARITWPERKLGLTMQASNNLGYLVVYAPTGEDFFCAEPVSHCTDAFNSRDGGGAITLQAGGELAASVSFQPHML
ncbi:MAG: aldose 1-epimerase [Alphaproteobacteria bacterium]|nr:aldose 1-epimerase [Alphaproteobacteria bacterium]